MTQIPQIIKDKAAKHGFNSISPLILRDGRLGYVISKVDDDGMPLPTGLPNIFVPNEDDIEWITGEQALELLD